MKFVLVLILGIVLGILGHRQFQQWQAPAVNVPTSTPDLPDTPNEVSAVVVAQPIAEPTVAEPGLALPPALTPVAAAGIDTAADSGALAVPVQGIAREQLIDTFTDARSEGRSHDAIDIMAPTGTPVLAVADGTVEKLFDSDRGGLTLYQFEPSGRIAYYYAHLDRYADGIVEGAALRRGQVIGYVGSTGNANPEAPHLHFAIFELGPERNWWQGVAINPYPVLRDESAR